MDQNELRRAVAAGLESSGKPERAALAADPRSTMLGPELALPGGMVAVGFGAFPHANASFFVGLAAGQVFYLTGQPDAFNEMTRVSGLRVADERTAELLARAYVETTRTMRTFSGVLDSADDIRWDTRPGRGPAPETVAQLRDYVRPPAVTAVGPGLYQVRLAVLNGAAVERRVLTVTPAGAVTEQTEDAIDGLPVPVSM
jgi:hypothetical protein